MLYQIKKFKYFLQVLNFVNYNEEIQSRKYKSAEDFYISGKNSELYFDCFNYYNFIMGFKSKLPYLLKIKFLKLY